MSGVSQIIEPLSFNPFSQVDPESNSKFVLNCDDSLLTIKNTITSHDFIKSPKNDLSVIYSAGGVQSTVEDMLRFGEAVLHNKLIEPATLEMMINATDELAPAMGDDPYGFGWSVYDDPDFGRIIQHGGTQPGSSAFFAVYLDHKILTVLWIISCAMRIKKQQLCCVNNRKSIT